MARVSIFVITPIAALWLACVLLSGCGSGETDESGAAPPPAAAHRPAAGTAIETDLEITELTLDSPITRVKDKNGLEFLHFKYTDKDGKVYKCVLPAAMAEGKRKIPAWIATFNVYRQPQVLAQKKVKRATEDLGDFPFISPKPPKEPEPVKEKPEPIINLPTAPTAPTGPAPGAPMAPGPTPGGAPGMPARPYPGTRGQ